MAKKNKTIVKERSLRTILSERIRFSGLYFPKRDNPELYKIPDPILTFFRKQFDENDLITEDDIEIVYSVLGELYGYYHLDNLERKITFVFFEVNEDFRNDIIFKLETLSCDLGVLCSENVVIRCCFLPNQVFYDNYISDELLELYSSYTCDACFYSKINPSNADMIYKGKLVRSFDKRAILEFEGKDFTGLHDIVYDLRKYKDSIDTDLVISTIKDKCLLKVPSFQLDRFPSKDGRLSSFATDIVCGTYIGYNKIYFILPEADEDKISKFITTVFEGADEAEYRPCFYSRYGFFISKTCDVNDTIDMDFKPLELSFVDNMMTRTVTKYIEVRPVDIFNRYFKKHLND